MKDGKKWLKKQIEEMNNECFVDLQTLEINKTRLMYAYEMGMADREQELLFQQRKLMTEKALIRMTKWKLEKQNAN